MLKLPLNPKRLGEISLAQIRTHMLCDLNVIWNSGTTRTIAALSDLGYTCIAVNVILSGKISPTYQSPIDAESLRAKFPKLRILTRVTVILDDASQNQNVQILSAKFDLICVRPLTEKSLQSASTNLDIDVISLDMTRRQPFYLRHKTVGAAIDRGIKFEMTYGAAPTSTEARRQVISNAIQIIRATRSRGIILSSEANEPGVCRGPYDVVNLACIWGLDHMRARDAVGKTAVQAVMAGDLRTNSYKQVIVERPAKRKRIE